jgi:hypothetical protein
VHTRSLRVGLSQGAKRMGMLAPDLRSAPPRRWNVAVNGIVWLPRFIDKARACDAGTLGAYLYGQSPVDDALLGRLALTYDEFLAIVNAAPDDDAVLAALEARQPGATERLQRWSARFAASQQTFLAFLDWDDGYRRWAPAEPLRPILRPAVNGCMSLLKTLRPWRVVR